MNADLKELWRRLILNIMIHNGDDHLRNHAFLLDHEKGWKLSPVFDINPILDKNKLSLSIDRYCYGFSISTALKTCDYYNLNLNEAMKIVDEIKEARTNWANIARKISIAESEITAMKKIFEDTCE